MAHGTISDGPITRCSTQMPVPLMTASPRQIRRSYDRVTVHESVSPLSYRQISQESLPCPGESQHGSEPRNDHALHVTAHGAGKRQNLGPVFKGHCPKISAPIDSHDAADARRVWLDVTAPTCTS